MFYLLIFSLFLCTFLVVFINMYYIITLKKQFNTKKRTKADEEIILTGNLAPYSVNFFPSKRLLTSHFSYKFNLYQNTLEILQIEKQNNAQKYLYIDKNSITLKKNFLSTPSLIFALNNLRTEFKISSFDYEKLKKYM